MGGLLSNVARCRVAGTLYATPGIDRNTSQLLQTSAAKALTASERCHSSSSPRAARRLPEVSTPRVVVVRWAAGFAPDDAVSGIDCAVVLEDADKLRDDLKRSDHVRLLDDDLRGWQLLKSLLTSLRTNSLDDSQPADPALDQLIMAWESSTKQSIHTSWASIQLAASGAFHYFAIELVEGHRYFCFHSPDPIRNRRGSARSH